MPSFKRRRNSFPSNSKMHVLVCPAVFSFSSRVGSLDQNVDAPASHGGSLDATQKTI
jgi:hypothetical protein